MLGSYWRMNSQSRDKNSNESQLLVAYDTIHAIQIISFCSVGLLITLI